MADEDEKVGDIMHTNIIYAHTDTDQEEIAQLFSKYSLAVLPIVDNEKRLVGIVTADDIIEVVQEEGTEDLQMVAAIAPIEDKPYLKTSVFSIWLQRIPWLCILMLSATFTGIVINSYESTLSPLLFACVPMLMGTGGNAGSQASVTAIRSIALGEVEFKDMFKVLWKEFRVSVILSITLAVVCFLKLQLIDRMMLGYEYSPIISLVICVAMVITILIAKIVGAALPILAKKLHLDPAVVASPFITTIVDVVSLLVYCNISILILG
jgi:magnesium transporter